MKNCLETNEKLKEQKVQDFAPTRDRNSIEYQEDFEIHQTLKKRLSLRPYSLQRRMKACQIMKKREQASFLYHIDFRDCLR